MPDDNPLSKSDRTARAILDAAYGLFVSQGYAATSMRQVAEKAGLALGGIYNHFSSKEEIFKAILLSRHPFSLVIPFLLDAPGESMDEFIHNAAQGMVSELGQHPEFLNLMLVELVEFKGRHAPMLIEKFFPDIQAVARRVTIFQADLRPIPGFLLMRAFIGLFFSYFITDLLLKNYFPPEMRDNSLKQFVDIFLNGIKLPAETGPKDAAFSMQSQPVIPETP